MSDTATTKEYQLLEAILRKQRQIGERVEQLQAVTRKLVDRQAAPADFAGIQERQAELVAAMQSMDERLTKAMDMIGDWMMRKEKASLVRTRKDTAES